MDKTSINTEQSTQPKEGQSKKKGLIKGLFIAGLVCSPFFGAGGYIFHQSMKFSDSVTQAGLDKSIKYGQLMVSIGDLSAEHGLMKSTGHFRASISNLCNDTVLDLGKFSFEVGHLPWIGDEAKIGWSPDTSQEGQDFLVFKKAKGQTLWIMEDTPITQTFLLNPSLKINPEKNQIKVNASFDYANFGRLAQKFEGIVADSAKIELILDKSNLLASTGTTTVSELSAGGFVSKDFSAELSAELSEEQSSEIALKVSTKQTALDVWHIDHSETDLVLNVGSASSLVNLFKTAAKTCSGYLVDQNQKFKVKSELNTLASSGLFVKVKSRLSINSEVMTAKATVDFEPKMDLASGEIDIYRSLIYKAESTIPTSNLSQAQINQIKASGFIDDLTPGKHQFKSEMTGDQIKQQYVQGYEKLDRPNYQLSRFLDEKLTYTAQALYLLPYSMPVLANSTPTEHGTSDFEQGKKVRLDTDGTTRILIKGLN